MENSRSIILIILIIATMLMIGAAFEQLFDCFSDAPGCNNHLPGVL